MNWIVTQHITSLSSPKLAYIFVKANGCYIWLFFTSCLESYYCSFCPTEKGRPVMEIYSFICLYQVFFSRNVFIIYNIPHEITPITKNIFELKCVRSEPTVAVRQTDMNLGDNQNWTYRVVFCKCQWRWILMLSNFENEWPNK